jgi:hypothetical protein
MNESLIAKTNCENIDISVKIAKQGKIGSKNMGCYFNYAIYVFEINGWRFQVPEIRPSSGAKTNTNEEVTNFRGNSLSLNRNPLKVIALMQVVDFQRHKEGAGDCMPKSLKNRKMSALFQHRKHNRSGEERSQSKPTS